MDQETSSDGGGGCRSRAGAPGSGVTPASRRSSDRSVPTPAVGFSRSRQTPRQSDVTALDWLRLPPAPAVKRPAKVTLSSLIGFRRAISQGHAPSGTCTAPGPSLPARELYACAAAVAPTNSRGAAYAHALVADCAAYGRKNREKSARDETDGEEGAGLAIFLTGFHRERGDS